MTTETQFDPANPETRRYDLDAPSLYLNRELAWLSYNRRVLHEAENDAAPLLERVAFLAAFGANLDAFFMNRVAVLKRLEATRPEARSVDGRTPAQQLAACRDHVQVYSADEAFVYFELCYLLAKEGVHLLDVGNLDAAQSQTLRDHYRRQVRPLLTPMAIDPNRPLPPMRGRTNNLLIEAREPDSGRIHLIRIELPVTAHQPRFVRISDRPAFVPIEQLVVANLEDLLPGAEIRSAGLYRVTEDVGAADGEVDAADLLDDLPPDARTTPAGRHYARLEISDDLPAHLAGFIASGLALSGARDVYKVNSLLGVGDLVELAGLPIARLRYPRIESAGHPRLSEATSVIGNVAAKGPLFLHHPYHDYERTVMPLLREAVADANVLAIKATVSRETRGSGFLPLLIMAARAGKQVVIVARSASHGAAPADRKWAAYLEDIGIKLTFGPPDHPPHAHAMLIVRKEENGSLGRTVHVSSGYHESSRSKPNTDVGLISAEPDVTDDVTELFNLMTSGLTRGRSFDALLVAPEKMKEGLIQRIRRERGEHESWGNGHIVIKANSLSDVDITRELYAAARAGVRIDLIIRSDCRLRPGLPGLTGKVRVVSVLGRYREHARVYYFRNRGTPEYFIGSADPMTRPLSQNVEVLIPVRGAQQADLAEMLRVQLEPGRGAWQMDANGDYRREFGGSDADAQTQMLLRAQRAEARAKLS